MKKTKSNSMLKVLGYSVAILLLFFSCSKENIGPAPQKQLKSTGTDHGFFWQNYVSSGSATISFPSAGTYAGNFALSYSNVGDVVSGKGWNPGWDHAIGYNIGALSGSYNNIGIYGWTTNPLIEYYVTEKGSVSGTRINTVNSDGHTYTFYTTQRVNAPSIQGTQTFWQYKDNWGGASVGQSYTVTMANHINNWRSNGGHGFGSYNLQIFALEAYGGKSGYINATVWDAGSGSSSGGGSSTSYVQLQNRATGLMVDGMGRTSNGSNCGQWSNSGSYNQEWAVESAGSYVKLKNRATGLYLDGMGSTSNGAVAGQWSSSSSYNQQWLEVTSGSYIKFQNRATGLYLDGMGRTSNGSDMGQWSSSSSYNQQFSMIAK